MSSPNSGNDMKGGMIANMMRRHSADEATRGSFLFRGFAGIRTRERTVSETVPEQLMVPSETSQKERRISVMSLSPI